MLLTKFKCSVYQGTGWKVFYMILTGSDIICDVINVCTGVCFDLPPKLFNLSHHFDPYPQSDRDICMKPYITVFTRTSRNGRMVEEIDCIEVNV